MQQVTHELLNSCHFTHLVAHDIYSQSPIILLTNFFKFWFNIEIVTTLALGSQPRQGLARLRAKRGNSGVTESVRE